MEAAFIYILKDRNFPSLSERKPLVFSGHKSTCPVESFRELFMTKSFQYFFQDFEHKHLSWCFGNCIKQVQRYKLRQRFNWQLENSILNLIWNGFKFELNVFTRTIWNLFSIENLPGFLVISNSVRKVFGVFFTYRLYVSKVTKWVKNLWPFPKHNFGFWADSYGCYSQPRALCVHKNISSKKLFERNKQYKTMLVFLNTIFFSLGSKELNFAWTETLFEQK